MKIAFDVDGVVLRSIDVILEHVNRVTSRNLTPDDLFMWDLEPLGLDMSTLRDAVNHMYGQPRIAHYEGAVRVLSRIYRFSGEPLLFITGRCDLETARRQLEALPWNPSPPEMIVRGGDRYKLEFMRAEGVDLIVEDDVKHLEEYLAAGFGVGLMNRPWNRRARIPVTDRDVATDLSDKTKLGDRNGGRTDGEMSLPLGGRPGRDAEPWKPGELIRFDGWEELEQWFASISTGSGEVS